MDAPPAINQTSAVNNSLQSWWIQNPCWGHTTGRAGFVFRSLINTIMASQCALASPCSYPDDFGPYLGDASVEDAVVFDFIIVGGGTAGSIIANRLSEIGTWKVLLLEAGGDPPMTVDVPLFWSSLQHSCIDWQFKTEPLDGLFQGMINKVSSYPQGKVLGGTSSIGKMVYMRGNRLNYDEWAKAGNTGWAYKDILNFFKKSEDVKVKEVLNCTELLYHFGLGGYLTVEKFYSDDILIQRLLEAAGELGYSEVLTPYDAYQIGFFSTFATTRDGERLNTAKAFLNPVQDRSNLFVVKHAQVTKILVNQTKKAFGVEYKLRNEKKLRKAKARKEVILSAGVLNSPKLLMLSGIGPSKHLKDMGIPALMDLPVGCNFHDHVTFPGVVLSLNTTGRQILPSEILDSSYEYLTRRTGLLSTIREEELIGMIGINEDEIPDVLIFFHTIKKNDENDLRKLTGNIALKEEIIEQYNKLNLEKDVFVAMPVLLNPLSRGKVQLSSKDPFAPPRLFPQYLTQPEDLDFLLSSIQFIKLLSETTSMKRHEAEMKRIEIPGCSEERFDTDSYWACIMSHTATSIYDGVGTAKMGPESDNCSVVNPTLKVKGIQGLRVADSSVIPTIPTGTVMSTVCMIAEKVSYMIKKEWLSEKVHSSENSTKADKLSDKFQDIAGKKETKKSNTFKVILKERIKDENPKYYYSNKEKSKFPKMLSKIPKSLNKNQTMKRIMY